MNEEEKLAQEASEAPESPDIAEAEEAETSPPPRRHSVFPYLAILFGTAFLLLLFAYLMQQRDSQEIMGNLSDLRASLGSIQSIDELTEENRKLREEMEALEKQVSGLEKQLEESQADLTVSKSMEEQWQGRLEVAQGTLDAFDSLTYLQALCDQGREDEAREMLDSITSDRDADGKLYDRVEYYLSNYVSKFIGMEDSPIEDYNPLEAWRALKEALAETEEETE